MHSRWDRKKGGLEMAHLKKMLVAYDGSPHSKEALNWAIDLSLLSAAEVVVVKVFDGALYTTAEVGARFLEALEEMRRADRNMMDEVVALGKEKGVRITSALLEGNVAGEIISYADQNKVDMIIAGTKGHGVLTELLLGSVTRNLVSLAHVPVLVVKE
jgi:nucleotide-binding universal stress UspA family protein